MVSLTNPMRMAIIGLSLLPGAFSAFYFLVALGTDFPYVHLFYVPIVLASAWWHKKSILLAFCIIAFILNFNFFFAPDVPIVNDLERSAILLVITIFTSTLFELEKEMKKQLLKAEKLAAIEEVATMVGHDLRNPLQSIENATYYLNNELPVLFPSTPIPQTAKEMLQVINDSVNFADKMIKDLQDFSATKTPTLEKTDINTLIEETLSQVEAPENVELRTELYQLPEIKVNKNQIKRIFMNLATNGIQAMENGGTLTVSTKKTGDFVEISFKDTGVGIPKENMEKLFSILFTTKAKGIGLGLPICKKFVELHGGSIEVKSQVGNGTTFTVKLPIPKKRR